MTELIWIVDPTTGELTVEGLSLEEASRLLGDLLPHPHRLDCARPLVTVPLPLPSDVAEPTIPTLRVLRLYHGSVVEGPGRRSVLQMAGCPIRCKGCFVPQSHDPVGGILLEVDRIVSALFDPVGEPRDGISILGGEPFYQPMGLLALLRELKARGLHTVVYTGYTLEALALRPEPEVARILDLIDLLIEGPFIAYLSSGAGEWRGSRNQRLIPSPGRQLACLHPNHSCRASLDRPTGSDGG
ncbi:MAG: radical SAM protein [Nitrososphaerota archaeon]|nr:radical SAM protein [Nitrososphaerota archaeon]